MRIRNIVHKGLRRLYERDHARAVPPDSSDKLRKMLAFLDEIEAWTSCARSPAGNRTS